MALNWEINNEPHGLFVTCYRPIVIGVKVTGNQPAHIQGTLLMEESAGEGEFSDTGIRMNGYSDFTNNSDGIYTINVADFCRPFFPNEAAFYDTNLCGNWNKMLSRAFKLRINPVLYQTNGALQVDQDDSLVTNAFVVSPTITKASESTSMGNDYIRLDKFVNNGENNSAVVWNDDSDWNVLTSNMPQNNVIDINSGFYYYQTLLLRGVVGRNNYCRVWNNTTGASYDFSFGSANEALHRYVSLHPVMLEFMLENFADATLNHIINTTTGELQTDSIDVQMQYKNNSTWALERWSPRVTYKLIDGRNSSCKQEHFVFRNMRGGMDWFIATGQQDKEVAISGEEYDRHIGFNRDVDSVSFLGSSEAMFGVNRGAHSRSSVWDNVQEKFKTFTQPLTKEYVEWLQELIVSPQVWIVKEVTDMQLPDGSDNADRYMLVAINIIKNSYKLHSTEKNVHYIEFQYSLSDNNLTQQF